MEQTALLKLPYIMPSQAQKHVTHNEVLRMLDAILHVRVEDRNRNDPPAAPVEGQRHMLGSEPVGAFAGQAGRIAAFQDGAWNFHAPQAGWLVWDAAAGELLVFDGEEWRPVAAAQDVPRLGVNATADETNRLAVSSAATLLSHDGAGHQLKINKAAPGDTGSLLFQTGWSGRAEMGLAGGDDFAIKVSADGSGWKEGLAVSRATGAVTMPYTLSVGGATMAGAINARASDGVPSLYMTSVGSFCYLQMQHGAIWLNTSSGGQIFRTRFDGSLVFDWTRSGTAGTDVGMQISSDRRVRIGNGGPASQSRLEIDGPAKVGAYTAAGLPSAAAASAGAIVFVSDEAGGATLAFSDGTNWRRVTDRAVVS